MPHQTSRLPEAWDSAGASLGCQKRKTSQPGGTFTKNWGVLKVSSDMVGFFYGFPLHPKMVQHFAGP